MIVLITGITLSTWDVYATAVGDTTKAYFLFLFFPTLAMFFESDKYAMLYL